MKKAYFKYLFNNKNQWDIVYGVKNTSSTHESFTSFLFEFSEES